MRKIKKVQFTYKEQINKFLDECMFEMYKGHDHIIARNYYLELFNRLIPRYFCICREKNDKTETRNNL